MHDAASTDTATCPQGVRDLVARFQEHREAYQDAAYNETQVRREFIDPFFKALGWDVDNEQGLAEAYKDVIHEDAIKVGGSTKAPDYCFRIGGVRKFFVEAKKPSVVVKDDPGPAYQLRRYAWTNKLQLSIVTDFEELAVYDGRIRPNLTDKASAARVMYLTFDKYHQKWGEIASIFSKDAILKGSFDKYAGSTRRKRGTAEVDAEFLKEIESWRETLAANVALRNPGLSVRDLNYAVGKIIDRIIFLRMCEDRGVETYAQLRTVLNGTAVYRRLMEMFYRADERHNSGLFHFQVERGRPEPPDELTPGLTIDDKVFKDILRTLYYPECPYEFSVLPVEILGQVYEQFLGKVIRLTAGHRAKVEEKPEVRKAGGVYYTPAYIVDYIVEHTVGKLLEGKTPAEVGPDRPAAKQSRDRKGAARASTRKPLADARGSEGRPLPDGRGSDPGVRPLGILDPACGSGSFLLGAYQYLLDWHRDWYVNDGPEKHRDRVYQGAGGQWRLTIAEKKRILLNNIYGVDIDPQAVEVTKLSLLLRVLEGETQESLENQMRLFHERALPDLGANIKCGNSLIGPDFYNGQQMSLFDEEERYRINVFDWHVEFPAVFTRDNAGFEAVIGNPPYVLLQDEFRDDAQLRYFRAHYAGASYKLDTYHLFIEKIVKIASAGGRCSMITPANFLTNNYLADLRRFMLEHSAMDHVLVIDTGVFRGISVDSAIFVTKAHEGGDPSFPLIHATCDSLGVHETSRTLVTRERALENSHALFTGASDAASGALWEKARRCSVLLGAITTVHFGKQLRDRKVFPRDVLHVPGLRSVPRSYRPCYTGADMSRYAVAWNGLACLNDESARRGGCWDATIQNAKGKLLTRQIGRYPVFALDERGYQCLNTMFMVGLHNPAYDPRYVLGLLNSRLLRKLWADCFYDQRRTFPKIKGTYLKRLPIRALDPNEPVAGERQQRTIELVGRMLDLHHELAAARTPDAKTSLQRQIDATDRQIDRLVYELYGLTDDEIRIVEEATSH